MKHTSAVTSTVNLAVIHIYSITDLFHYIKLTSKIVLHQAGHFFNDENYNLLPQQFIQDGTFNPNSTENRY